MCHLDPSTSAQCGHVGDVMPMQDNEHLLNTTLNCQGVLKS